MTSACTSRFRVFEGILITCGCSDANRPSFASQADAAILKAKDATEFPNVPEDADDWLNVDAEDLDAMLEKTFGQSAAGQTAPASGNANVRADVSQEEEQLAQAQASRLQDLAKKVEEFVEGEGDLEGARFQE